LNDIQFNLILFSSYQLAPLLYYKDGRRGYLPQMPHAGSANRKKIDPLIKIELAPKLELVITCMLMPYT